MCRADLEASAFSEFEADFVAFKKDLESWRDVPAELHSLNLALVGAERCRRRLYDAALVRFLKLLGASHMDTGLAREIRTLVNELLTELHQLREVLERRRRSHGGIFKLVARQVASVSPESTAELLESLSRELSHFLRLLRRLAAAPAGDIDRTTSPSGVLPLDAQDGDEISSEFREHLGQMRQLCQTNMERLTGRPRCGGA